TTGVTGPAGAGTLTIDSENSILEIFYVNGFAPTNYTLAILNYGAVSGAFDLANNLIIHNATGAAADVSNYNITYDGNTAYLHLVPEPSVGALGLLSIAGLMSQRRRRK